MPRVPDSKTLFFGLALSGPITRQRPTVVKRRRTYAPGSRPFPLSFLFLCHSDRSLFLRTKKAVVPEQPVLLCTVILERSIFLAGEERCGVERPLQRKPSAIPDPGIKKSSLRHLGESVTEINVSFEVLACNSSRSCSTPGSISTNTT